MLARIAARRCCFQSSNTSKFPIPSGSACEKRRPVAALAAASFAVLLLRVTRGWTPRPGLPARAGARGWYLRNAAGWRLGVDRSLVAVQMRLLAVPGVPSIAFSSAATHHIVQNVQHHRLVGCLCSGRRGALPLPRLAASRVSNARNCFAMRCLLTRNDNSIFATIIPC
jgi:hypothetical protein